MAENSPKIRLCIATGIYPPDIGGPATYSKLLFNELPERGIETTVVTFGSVRKLPKVIRHIAYFFLLLIKSVRSNIIFAQDPVSVGLPSMWAAKLLRKKFVLKVVGDYAWEQGTARFNVTESLDSFSKIRKGYHPFVLFLKYVQKRVAEEASVVIVPSNYLKSIVANWGIRKKKIVVIYNAFEVPRDIAEKEVLRSLMRLEGKVIVSVGRLVPWKGFETLVNIMPQILKTIPDAKLLIVGSGILEKELRTLVEKTKLEEHVVLTGRLDHETLLRYMKASDLFVLNTYYEGFSHLLLECMALGVPILTTKVGGNTELIEHRKNGFLVRYNDKAELRKYITAALSDKGLAASVVKNARTKVKQFDTETMINTLLEVLQKQ